jgi:hypothetical protein
MADIFISYARPDRPRAEQLAHALERVGWSVWWDREIPPGRSFDEVIEEALSLARCVIVLWSEASVRSEWVKTEASEAAQRHILVPILADGARIPLEFRRIQAAAIDDWRNLESNAGWAQLCDAVSVLATSERRASPVLPIAAARRGYLSWAIAGGATLAIAAGAAAYVVTRASAPVARATVAPAPAPAPASAMAAPAAQPAAPAAAKVEETPVPVPSPDVTRLRPKRTEVAKTDVAAAVSVAGAAVAAAPPHDEPEPAPLIAVTTASRDAARKLDREPRPVEGTSSYDVTLVSGVFRDRGRLSVSGDGVRFQDSGGSGRMFELPCGALRRVATATMIADREQRLLELTANERAYRLLAPDTGMRDSIRAAISRTCTR